MLLTAIKPIISLETSHVLENSYSYDFVSQPEVIVHLKRKVIYSNLTEL